MTDEPILKLRASRWGSNNPAFPNEIWIYEDRVEEHKPGIVGHQTETIPYKQVAQVALTRPRVGWAILKIESTGGHVIRAQGLVRAEADKAKAEIEARVHRVVEGQSGGAPNSGPASPTDEIARLVEMKEKGMLTDEEFAAAKKSLLGL